jgi:uncharacterized membrane protein YgdD (TMEM256/DUF423 family)
MNTLNALIDEVLGLFVDDGSLALATLAIVALAGWVSLRFENASLAVGIILFVGCLVALAENVLRSARKANL